MDSEHAPDSSRCFPFKILRIFAPTSKSGRNVCFVLRTEQLGSDIGGVVADKILQQLVRQLRLPQSYNWSDKRPNQLSKLKNGFQFSGGRYKRPGREMRGTRWPHLGAIILLLECTHGGQHILTINLIIEFKQ